MQDSVASYPKKITASSRNRSAAFELAIKSGRNYQAGDQISYYITGATKKVTAYENARFVSEWNPEARDENVEYYVAKLDELATKFEEHAPSVPCKRPLCFMRVSKMNAPPILIRISPISARAAWAR